MINPYRIKIDEKKQYLTECEQLIKDNEHLMNLILEDLGKYLYVKKTNADLDYKYRVRGHYFAPTTQYTKGFMQDKIHELHGKIDRIESLMGNAERLKSELKGLQEKHDELEYLRKCE